MFLSSTYYRKIVIYFAEPDATAAARGERERKAMKAKAALPTIGTSIKDGGNQGRRHLVIPHPPTEKQK